MLLQVFLSLNLLLGVVDSHKGSLNIDLEENEMMENKNKDLTQYDTSLFTKESKIINEKISKGYEERIKKAKKSMFKGKPGNVFYLSETKKTLFKSNYNQEKPGYEKEPYIQNKQSKSIVIYITLGIGIIMTVGFIVYIFIRRKREQS